MGKHRTGLIFSAFLAVIAAACSLAPYVAIYAVTVALFVVDEPEQIPWIAGWAALALVVRAIANSLATHLGHVAAYRVLKDLRLALAAKLRRMPLGQVQARSTGELKKLMHDDVEQLEEALAHGIPDGAAAAAVPAATTVLLFAVDWRLALVALLSLVLLIAVSAVGIALGAKNNKASAEHTVVLNRTIMGYLQGIKVIRGYLRTGAAYSEAAQAVVEGARLEQKSMSGPARWVVAAMSVATSLTVVLLLPFAGQGFIDGNITLPTLVLFLLLGLAYLNPIVSLVGTIATIMVRVQFASKSVDELFAEPELPEPEEPRCPETYEVEFDDVAFGYTIGNPVLENINLRVPVGTTVALVGATGSGKSTLARLLGRFYDVDSGTVCIGGVDVRDISLQELSRIVALIQQDEYIFEETLLENIRIARPEATDPEVIGAAEQAQLGDVIQQLERGIHTVLSAGGTDLSGGQRQRIAIARALLKNASVIVLDEATAALDAETEQATLAAISQVSQGRTVIAIAHRLNTIINSDQIIFLADGRIQAQGTHEELLSICPPYAALWQAYTSAAGWRLESSDTTKPTPKLKNVSAPVSEKDSVTAQAPEATLVEQGLAQQGFLKQWRTLYGASWETLLRKGLVRMVAESLVKSAPLVAALVAVVLALDSLTTQAVWLITALLGLALLIRLFANVWSNALVWRLATESKTALQLSLLDRLRRVPLGFFQKVDAGRINTLITNDTVMIDFQNVPQQVVATVIQPLVGITALLMLDWRLALASLVGVPIFLALTAWGDAIYRRVFADLHRARHKATSAMLEQARGAAVLRGNPATYFQRRYEQAMTELSETSTAMSVKASPATALGSIAIEAGQVVLILIGAWLYGADLVGAPVLLIFLFLSLSIYQPIQELNTLAGYRRNQQQIASKIAEVWDAPVLPEPQQPQQPNGFDVQFNEVNFDYQDKLQQGQGIQDQAAAEPTIKNVSFTARSGEITALVGHSGSGKSTIGNLIARLWDVDSGSITIGGVDVRQLGSEGVLNAVTTVFQDVYFFDATLRANLTIGQPEATDAQVWEALKAAQCDDVVAALPQGLDTVLNDGGTDLSGGQRQRLAIARALLKDSPILILDEAVAAVDPGTEDRIQQALASLATGRTVIVIAHRISTIVSAPTIVVLEHGRIAGTGTHHELLHTCPAYQQLGNQHV